MPVLLFSRRWNFFIPRCGLSPSPATGLVGLEENTFLGDYFRCVGVMPLASQRCSIYPVDTRLEDRKGLTICMFCSVLL